jgi:hypothetical protein
LEESEKVIRQATFQMETLLQLFRLSNFPSGIPFDAAVTLLIFLVGIPALVLQFMAPDVRRVTMEKITFPKEVSIRLVIAVSLMLASVLLAWGLPASKDFIFATMLVGLFVIVAATTVQVQFRYGWRETVIATLKKKVLISLERHGRLDKEALQRIIEIGKQSEAGPDREVILEALDEIVARTRLHLVYDGDMLGSLVDGLVKMLVSQPAPEDTPNYQLAVRILIAILSAPNVKTLIDQQHAVRALSALGQTLLAEIAVTVGTDHIMMDYEEALGLAVTRHPSMLTDVTQSLLEVGAVALNHKHYLFAVATLERLLTIVEENLPSREALADLLGLLAHFWTDGESSREFAESRSERIGICAIKTEFPIIHQAIQHAKLHSQMTMRFNTADKLAQMARDLKPNRKPRRKKK